MNPESFTSLQADTLFAGKKAKTLCYPLAEPSPSDAPAQKIGKYQRNGKKQQYVVDKVEHVNST
jgi:hypothetical protein